MCGGSFNWKLSLDWVQQIKVRGVGGWFVIPSLPLSAQSL
jgi:hypothetical protein